MELLWTMTGIPNEVKRCVDIEKFKENLKSFFLINFNGHSKFSET